MLNFNKELQNILEVAIPVLIKKKEQLQKEKMDFENGNY